MAMSVHTYSIILGAGGAALALWTVVRFPDLGPTRIAVSAVNVVVAYLGGLWLASVLIPFFAGFPVVGGSLALAAIGGALPVIVYLFVSVAWLIRCLQGMLMPLR
jgi:hypothetical protein